MRGYPVNETCVGAERRPPLRAPTAPPAQTTALDFKRIDRTVQRWNRQSCGNSIHFLKWAIQERSYSGQARLQTRTGSYSGAAVIYYLYQCFFKWSQIIVYVSRIFLLRYRNGIHFNRYGILCATVCLYAAKQNHLVQSPAEGTGLKMANKVNRKRLFK